MISNRDSCTQMSRKFLTVAQNGRHFFVRGDGPRWLVVNQTGALILRLHGAGRPLDEIVETICKEYDSSPGEVEREVLSFWSDVEASQFLAEPSPQGTQSVPLRLESPELYVTTRCNGSCTHCAVRGAFREGDMPRETFHEAVRQSAALGAWRVVITGGEPFMREDLLDLLRSVESNVRIQILTNGALIDAARARELARLKIAVQVSLDGGCREVNDPIRGEGAFDLALQAIRLLRDAAVSPLTINFTIQKASANDVPCLLELAEREGIREVTFTPLVPAADGERTFRCADADSVLIARRYLHQYDGSVHTGLRFPGFGMDAICGRRWCAPGQSPSIGPDGSVFPCTPFARTPFVAGRIPKDTLEQVIKSKTIQELRRACQERADRIEECWACAWKHFCRAGCPAIAYHQHGTLSAKDCFCEARKRLYSDLFLGGRDNGGRCPE